MRALPTAPLSMILLSLGLGLGCDAPDPGEDAGASADAGAPDDGGPADAGEPLADAGPAPDTWTSFASDFMQTYCVECHAASPRDFNLLEDVRNNSPRIRCGTSDVALDDCGSGPPPRQFPVGSGPRPTDEERARLVAWFDAGAPE